MCSTAKPSAVKTRMSKEPKANKQNDKNATTARIDYNDMTYMHIKLVGIINKYIIKMHRQLGIATRCFRWFHINININIAMWMVFVEWWQRGHDDGDVYCIWGVRQTRTTFFTSHIEVIFVIYVASSKSNCWFHTNSFSQEIRSNFDCRLLIRIWEKNKQKKKLFDWLGHRNCIMNAVPNSLYRQIRCEFRCRLSADHDTSRNTNSRSAKNFSFLFIYIYIKRRINRLKHDSPLAVECLSCSSN